MKLVIVLGLIAVASAATLPVEIVRQVIENNEDGSYSHNFETSDGTKVEESGKNKQIDPENAGMTSRGSYSYTAPDGSVITTTWVADENGFQPSGAHLPVAPEAPPLPDHVVKLLDTLRAAGVL